MYHTIECGFEGKLYRSVTRSFTYLPNGIYAVLPTTSTHNHMLTTTHHTTLFIAEEFEKTTIKDFLPILYTLLKVVGVLVILGTGNILLMGGAFWAYRSYTAQAKEKELKEQGKF